MASSLHSFDEEQEMEKADICKLCFEDFGDQRRPRVLHCGHSYCTDCLEKLFENGNLSCPKCKRNHQVSSTRDFSINYDLEEILLDARKAKATVVPSGHSSKRPTKMKTIIAEQTASIQNLMLSAEDMTLQLIEYDEFLLERKAEHESVLQKIRELAKLHEGFVKEIEEERKRTIGVQKEGDKYHKEVKDKLLHLVTSEGNKAAAVALAEVVECSGELEGWIDQCQQEFPHPKIAVTQQLLTKTIDVLSSVDLKVYEKVPIASCLSDNDLKIMEKLAEILDNKLTLDKLRDKEEHWRKRIAEDQVYAIDSSNGMKRSAILSEREGKIYLHYLQDRKAPAFVYTIEQSEVVKSLNKDSTVVFLDLAWDGSFKGRVHILLSPDTPLARHFRILCTGDLGPSYAHSKFFKHKKNHTYEWIIGGDYEYNDGRGGAPVMDTLDMNDVICNRQYGKGVVLAPFNAREEIFSQFLIIIHGDHREFKGIFGKVKDGIEVLEAAARFRDIREVEIINCGVQLPL